MSFTRYTATAIILIICFCQTLTKAWGQYGISIDIDKPEEFDNRLLRAEKSDQKKFRFPTRVVQNTTTHYNYFFNANNKLNEILERAKLAYKDDYSQLLGFYNYTLDVTAADTLSLDSVSYKAQTGIVLHDLRSDWADNMYLLWGISYYLKQQFDSAYLMFQFINYAFAEKEEDGYYRTIGSGMDGNDAFSISTKEKSSLPARLLTRPPSRNDAFIWQIRNFLAQEKYAKAASMIAILRNDPVFPKRLNDDLEEVQAYFFYKQKNWDSAAFHLSNALSNATNKQEKARWEYLAGQLFEMSGHYTKAEAHYAKAIQHTTDPIMEIYARLASVRVNKEEGRDYIGENIATLKKMGKRDKYSEYRDIIYFMAAQMELERTNTDGAIAMLVKSTGYPSNSPSQRNKAFLQLGELSFAKRLYRQSYNFYDSIRMEDPELKDPDAILKRKDILERLAQHVEIIERQDSLQRLALMPEDERKSFVRKMARQLRRQQGLKEENYGSISPLQTQQQPAPALFGNNEGKGEWYFYNKSYREKGATDFKARWGNRPNSDNWRRSAALSAIVKQAQVSNTINDPTQPADPATQQSAQESGITFESLYEKIPLTQLQLQESNDSVNTALYVLGLIYIQELEDCEEGTATLEKLRQRSPDHPKMDEILFNLYYCNKKRGGTESSYALKKALTEKYPNSNFTTIITTGKNPEAEGPREEPTKAYEEIYDLFIEGRFNEAIAKKKVADNLYKDNYWTPQLLYIEAVYYIKQKDDSTAKNVLNNVIAKFGNSPLAEKAKTMLDVLSRRSQIEEELRNLVITMPPPDTARRYREPVVDKKPEPAVVQQAPPRDTLGTPPVTTPPTAVNTADTSLQQVPQAKDSLQQDTTAKVQPPARDSLAVDSAGMQPPLAKDSLLADTNVVYRPDSSQALSPYRFEADKPHFVVVVLNKVDPIFVNEARNAFYRYNRSAYYSKQMTAELLDLSTDDKLVLISPFKDLQEAMAYVEQTRPKTATEIIPWLKGGKYTYSIITEKNLEALKSSKDIDNYRKFLEQYLPGKF